jgi:curved DNA-binding protein CbpA
MRNRNDQQNYYEILEISAEATPYEIHAAYKKAKETYSPDSPALYSMFTPEEAQDLIALIEEAYRTLSDHSRRSLYDREVGSDKNLATEAGLEDMPLPDVEPLNSPKPKPPVTTYSASASSKESVPEGFARTKFGIYEVDSEFEGLLKTTEAFDGTLIQKVRLYKNINLDQLSDETRISRQYLAAIEAHDFEALPAPVFVRGFVSQIARALGIDQKQAASSYMELLKKV